MREYGKKHGLPRVILRPGAVFLFDYLNVHRELEKLVEKETRTTPMGESQIERWFDRSDRSCDLSCCMCCSSAMHAVAGSTPRKFDA